MEKANVKIKLAECKSCGKQFASAKLLEFVKGKITIPPEVFGLCSDCKRKRLRDQIRTTEKKISNI